MQPLRRGVGAGQSSHLLASASQPLLRPHPTRQHQIISAAGKPVDGKLLMKLQLQQSKQKKIKTLKQSKQEDYNPPVTSSPADVVVSRTLSASEPAKEHDKQIATEAIANTMAPAERILTPSSEQQRAVGAEHAEFCCSGWPVTSRALA